MPNSQKGFAPVLIIIVLAIALGGYVLYTNYSSKQIKTVQITTSPTPAASNSGKALDTSKWETYTNTRYNYSIKYPANVFFHCTKEPAFQDGFYLYKGQSEETCTAGEGAVAFYIKDNAASDYSESSYPDCYLVARQLIRVGDTTANKYTNDILRTTGKCQVLSSYAKNEVKIVLLQEGDGHRLLIGFQEDKDKELKYKILSTFRSVQATGSKEAVSGQDREIPREILSELPSISPDEKKVTPLSMANNNFLVYQTFVKERGGGKEYDYWVFNRTTKESINLSTLLKNNNNFIKAYKEIPKNGGLYLTFTRFWMGDNPVFSIADGWSIVGEYWVYDLSKGVFYYYSRKDTLDLF